MAGTGEILQSLSNSTASATNAVQGFSNALQTFSGTGANTLIGSNPVAINGGLVSTQTFLTTLEWDHIGVNAPSCGHHLIPDAFEYQDGKIIASCPTCTEVFAFEAVPGGISYLRVRALVADLLDDDPEGLHKSLGEFVALRAAVQAELAALEEGQELLRIAHEMLKKQLRKASCETSHVPESAQI